MLVQKLGGYGDEPSQKLQTWRKTHQNTVENSVKHMKKPHSVPRCEGAKGGEEKEEKKDEEDRGREKIKGKGTEKKVAWWELRL